MADEDDHGRSKRQRLNLPSFIQFTERRHQSNRVMLSWRVLKDSTNFVRLELMDRARNQYKHLEQSQLKGRLPKKSFYAGIDSTNINPVFIRTKTTACVVSDLENNYSGGMTKTSDSFHKGVALGLVVPTCDMLCTGQITFLKIQTLNHKVAERHGVNFEFAASHSVAEYLTDQDDDFVLGRPFSVFVKDRYAVPDYAAFDNTKPDN
ncbi:hypothetical protein CkaCkLH20_07135 [Colletotrichum karsti]|uniref:Uncharacterized protein n=1 Tax=Colletotrichum karsti TaxID=1095194 RepID=A0A9P6I3S9_9PEZI|nr:uncharacterized protein CkaCkLH20_07135 [Colletotrichum karsti]KAF9875315.1 hypothetical protein CkaCkLH20_07135 [Colletotrichum karsti]